MFKGLTSTISPFAQAVTQQATQAVTQEEATLDLKVFSDMCSDYRKTIIIDSDDYSEEEEEGDITHEEAVFYDSIVLKRDNAPLSPKEELVEDEEEEEEEGESEESEEEFEEEDSEDEEDEEPKRKKLKRKFTAVDDAFISEYYEKYGFKFNKIPKSEFQHRLPGISKAEAQQRAGVLFKQYLPRKKQKGSVARAPRRANDSSPSASTSPVTAASATKKHYFTKEEDAIIKEYYINYGLNFRAIPKEEFRARLPGMNGCKNQAKSRAKVLFNYKAPATEAEDMLIETMRKAGIPSKDVVAELNKLNPNPEKHRQTYFVDNRYKVIRNSNQREWSVEECYALCELFEEYGGDFVEMSKDRSGLLRQRPIAHMRAKYIQLTENI